MEHEYIKRMYSKIGEFESLDKVASRTDTKRLKFTYRIINEVINNHDIKNILEIGPGSGYITDAIGSIAQNKGIELDVLDFSDSFLETTKAKNLNINNSIIRDISSQDFFLNKKYDFIVFQDVLEHTVSPYQTMYNISSILNEEGVALVTIPNSNYYKDIINSYRLFNTLKKDKLFNSHIAKFSPIGAFKLFSMTGFQVKKIEYYSIRIPFFDMFFSQEISFLLKKISTPEEAWNALEEQTISYWKNIL